MITTPELRQAKRAGIAADRRDRRFDAVPKFAVRALIAMMLVALALVGANRALAQTASPPSAGPDYLIGPGDVLKITVFRAPDLDTAARVSGNGTITMGLIGDVPVAGLTASAVAELLEDRLKAGGMYVNPSVSVLVSEYHSNTVSVLGAIARPGEYPIDQRDLTITEVLARAGANFDTGGTVISVVAPGAAGSEGEKFHVADLVSGTRNRPVRAGESIFVQAPATFYIAGEVQRASAYPIEPGLTIGQAIAIAGGLTPRGSRSRIRVTRRNAQGAIGRPEKGRLTDVVQPDDLIDVGKRIF